MLDSRPLRNLDAHPACARLPDAPDAPELARLGFELLGHLAHPDEMGQPACRVWARGPDTTYFVERVPKTSWRRRLFSVFDDGTLLETRGDSEGWSEHPAAGALVEEAPSADLALMWQAHRRRMDAESARRGVPCPPSLADARVILGRVQALRTTRNFFAWRLGPGLVGFFVLLAAMIVAHGFLVSIPIYVLIAAMVLLLVPAVRLASRLIVVLPFPRWDREPLDAMRKRVLGRRHLRTEVRLEASIRLRDDVATVRRTSTTLDAVAMAAFPPAFAVIAAWKDDWEPFHIGVIGIALIVGIGLFVQGQDSLTVRIDARGLTARRRRHLVRRSVLRLSREAAVGIWVDREIDWQKPDERSRFTASLCLDHPELPMLMTLVASGSAEATARRAAAIADALALPLTDRSRIEADAPLEAAG